MTTGGFRLLTGRVIMYTVRVCSLIRRRSEMGSCEFVNWSRWYHISRADRPLSRIRVFRFAVAIASVTGETAPPSGETRNSSSSSSARHFSATGFLVTFLTRPISTVILCRRNSSSLDREENAGDGSIDYCAWARYWA